MRAQGSPDTGAKRVVLGPILVAEIWAMGALLKPCLKIRVTNVKLLDMVAVLFGTHSGWSPTDCHHRNPHYGLCRRPLFPSGDQGVTSGEESPSRY